MAFVARRTGVRVANACTRCVAAATSSLCDQLCLGLRHRRTAASAQHVPDRMLDLQAGAITTEQRQLCSRALGCARSGQGQTLDRSQCCDSIGNHHTAFRSKLLGHISKELIPVIGIRLGKNKIQFVSPDQPVVAEREFPRQLFPHLHIGQIDAHGLHQHHRRRYLGLVGGFQCDVVFVRDGRFRDAELNADELAVQKNPLVGGQACVNLDATAGIGVLRRAGSPAVVARRQIWQLSNALLIAHEAANVSSQRLVL